MQKSVIRFILLFSLIIAAVNSYGQESDPIIKYYLSGADSVYDRQYVFNNDGKFAFSVTSFFYRTNYRGEMEETDTAGYRLYFNGRKLDSTVVLDSAAIKENVPPANFDIFLPTGDSSYLYLFPNDTGAGKLAIGFESVDRSGKVLLTGLINIDRDTFHPVSLIYYNLEPSDFDRLSEAFEFSMLGPYLVLSGFQKQGVKTAFLGKAYITQTMILSDYELR